MSFPSFIILQASHKSPFLFIIFFPTSPIFFHSHPTNISASMSLFNSVIPWLCSQSLMLFALTLHSYTHLCIKLFPPASTCYHKLQPSFLEPASLCSFMEQCKKVTTLPKDNLSFSSHRMKGHSNHFNSVLEKVVSKFATEVRLFCPNPQHVHLELRRRNF